MKQEIIAQNPRPLKARVLGVQSGVRKRGFIPVQLCLFMGGVQL